VDATDQKEHVYTTDDNRLDEIKTNVAIQQEMAGEPEPEDSGATAPLEGWVEHELDKKAGTWARRWWRLRGHCLRVYESQDAVGTPLHTIAVASCALRAPKSTRKGRDGALRIDVKSDGLKMIVDVGSGEARQQWEKALTWRPALHSPLAEGLYSAAAAKRAAGVWPEAAGV
jgi:hypothetical protein